MIRSKNRVPLPPKSAEVHTMSCQYCIVGCGYKAYVWPVETPEGGPKASENALGADFPVGAMTGQWVSPGFHTVTRRKDGRDYNVVIIPDKDCVVNQGNHSSRGGTNAQAVYTPYGPTADRLTRPLVRVGEAQQPISWNAAVKIAGTLLKHAVEKWGPEAVGFRMFPYEFYENTYAITKLYFGKIGTPNAAFHNRPSFGGETPGLEDCGVSTWSIGYVDAEKAETVVAWGANMYETQDVLFTQHVIPGGAKLVVVDPRRTLTAAYAESKGGVHLQVIPGTDALLAGALARHIIEQGWEAKDFISRMASRAEIDAEDNWRRRKFGITFDEFKAYLQKPEYALDRAAKVTGVPADKIQRAAELIAKPASGGRGPRTVFFIEKGAIWNINYETVASIADLALLTGNVGEEGRGISRAGGHQEGFMGAAGYPIDRATDTDGDGHKIPNYLDEHIASGEVRIQHIIGANTMGMTASAQWARQMMERRLDVGPNPESADPDEVIRALKARMDRGGLVLMVNDIYPNLTTSMADLVLPAAMWGEHAGSRWNGERRLRTVSPFTDPPGEAKPDWWIIARIAKEMGYDGFDWKDDNDVFTEASEASKEGHEDYTAVVELAKQQGKTAHQVMFDLGTNGVQLPAKLEGGKIVGTVRLHEGGHFDTKSGKAMFIRAEWTTARPVWEALRPDPARGEFWVVSGRVDEIWQTMYTDKRKPSVMERWPMNCVEIHPEDARALGIQSGDLISLSSDRVFTAHRGVFDRGSLTVAAYVSDIVPKGVLFVNFAFPDQWANVLVPRWLHPVNPVPPFKLARATIKKVGTSDLAERTSFLPRNVI